MKAFLVAAALSIGAFSAFSEDWAQWRGPKRDGISRETGLLQKWPGAGPRLLWQNKEVGEGYGSPAVANNVVYLTFNSGVEDESVAAFSATDGKHLWSTRIGAVGNPKQNPSYPGARSTPTIEGDMLYVLGSDGDIAALEIKNGAIKWQKNARKEFGGEPGVWAYSESPLIDGEAVVFAPGAAVSLVALNKKNGDLLWKTSVPGAGQAAYSSTVVMETGGVRQYVQSLQNCLIGVEAKSGKFLWRFDRAAKGSPASIPTPIVKDNLIYTAGAFTGGALVKVTFDGETAKADEVYFSPKLPVAMGAILVGNHLYGSLQNKLMCVEFATGNVLWEERSISPASLLFADGNLYLHGEEGAVALVEASPAAYREKGKFTPAEIPPRPNKGKAWSFPALANGKLIIRDGPLLACYDVKGADLR